MRLSTDRSQDGFFIFSNEQSIALPLIRQELKLPKADGLATEFAFREHPEYGVWQTDARLINHGEHPLEVGPFSCCEFTIDASDRIVEHWWMHKGAGWSSPVGTYRDRIIYGYRFREAFSCYVEDGTWEIFPWSAFVDPTSGHGYIVGFGLTGKGRLQVERHDRNITIATSLDHDETYTTRLAAGETWTIPTTYILPFENGLDEACHQWRQFVQNELRPPSPDDRYPILINNSWGSEMAVDEALAKRMIDDAVDLGFELFGLDAGWFQALGDWHADANKFPKGLAELADYAHGKNLMIGLWVAWTQGDRSVRGNETVSFENPDQRTWFAQDYAPEWQKRLPYIGADLCLASKDAQNWCLAELRRIVRDYKLDMLEHDQRMVISECVRVDHGHTNHPADAAYRAGLGYHFVYDALRAEFPKLGFENCVNGGRMIDFESLKRCHYVCITDSYDRLSVRKAFYDSSRALPPMMCEVYLHNETGPTKTSFVSMLRSGMMSFCTLMIDTGRWPEEWRQAAREHLAFYKSFLRPLIKSARLYHVTDRPDGRRWDGMQYFDPETGLGVLFAFKGSEGATRHVFSLRGLDPEAQYRLEFYDESQEARIESGLSLMRDGLIVQLVEPDSSEMVKIIRQ